MEDSGIVLAVRLVKLGKFSAVTMHHSQVERPEVLIEWHIYKILNTSNNFTLIKGRGTYIVNVEEESVLVILGRLNVRNPEKPVWNNFNGFSIRRSKCLFLFCRSLPLGLTRIYGGSFDRRRLIHLLLLVSIDLSKLLRWLGTIFSWQRRLYFFISWLSVEWLRPVVIDKLRAKCIGLFLRRVPHWTSKYFYFVN